MAPTPHETATRRLRHAMRPLLAVALLTLSTVVAVRPAAAQDPAAGRRAVQRFGCVNCHAVPAIRERADGGCVGCHQDVQRRAARTLGRGPEVEHLLTTPSLTHVSRRLSEDYLVAYLQDPHDVRHRLDESMPRLPIGARDARDIVAFLRHEGGTFEAPSSPAPSASRVARGQTVFADAGCAGCHAFGNAPAPYALPPAALIGLGDAATLAPNLRYARERMDPDTMLAWIRDPASVDPDAHMQKPEISRDDAVAVRDYILLGDLGRPARPRRAPSIADLTPLERSVPFAEVRALFGQSCIHCHSHANDGASQALGFAPLTLDLSTWEGVRAGVTTEDGAHRSILEPGPDGVPPLLARLLARHDEARRDIVVPGRDPLEAARRAAHGREPVGMPLGLPPLSVQQLRVIYTWIGQGAGR